MKAEDLQIGDLVQLFPDQCRVDGIICLREEHTAEEKWMAIVHLGGNKYERVNVGILEPIPLTPEILEKNNHLIQGDLPILFDDGKMHYSIIECRYVSKEYERNGDTFYCLLSGCGYPGGSFVTPFAKVRYVHELQHALKLCEIEKEIVL